MPLYPTLDVQITLRCNNRCLNCIKLCGMEDVTGLDYSGADMSMRHILALRDNLIDLTRETGMPAVGTLCLTGGEPTIHPQLPEFIGVFTPLIGSVIERLEVNSNLLHNVPAVDPYLINYSTVSMKPKWHNTVLLHPGEINPGKVNTFAGCTHYRKWRPVCNVFGFSMCCAGDGYIRLFGLKDLVIPRLPVSPAEFPLEKMDAVCRHCPFGCENIPLERDLGRPVSRIYKAQAKHNRCSRS